MKFLAPLLALFWGTSEQPPVQPPAQQIQVVVPGQSDDNSRPPFVFNINNKTTILNSTSAVSEAQSSAAALAKNSNSNQALATNVWADMADPAKKWLAHYRTRIVLGSAAGCYASLYWHLTASYYAIDHSFWGNWKKHLSNEDLWEQLIDEQIKKELSKKLAQDIFAYHINPRDPTNNISPLIDFSQTIKGEIALMSRYIVLSETILKLRLSYLFPVSHEKIEIAKKHRARLKLLNTLFVSWAASYNFNKF